MQTKCCVFTLYGPPAHIFLSFLFTFLCLSYLVVFSPCFPSNLIVIYCNNPHIYILSLSLFSSTHTHTHTRSLSYIHIYIYEYNCTPLCIDFFSKSSLQCSHVFCVLGCCIFQPAFGWCAPKRWSKLINNAGKRRNFIDFRKNLKEKSLLL